MWLIYLQEIYTISQKKMLIVILVIANALYLQILPGTVQKNVMEIQLTKCINKHIFWFLFHTYEMWEIRYSVNCPVKCNHDCHQYVYIHSVIICTLDYYLYTWLLIICILCYYKFTRLLYILTRTLYIFWIVNIHSAFIYIL